MTMLTGRPDNYVRIKESQYQADITAAEARGRASAAGDVANNPAKPESQAGAKSEPVPVTAEQASAMEELKSLRAEKEAEKTDPAKIAAKLTDHVAKAKSEGRTIGLAQAAYELGK